MSLLTARATAAPHIIKSAHTTAIAGGLVALPVAAVLAVAYGADVIHFFTKVFVQVGVGGSKISNLPVDAAFAAIIGVIVVAIGLAVHEHRDDRDEQFFDVR